MSGRFIQQVEISVSTQTDRNRDRLAFTTGEFLDSFWEKLVNSQRLDDVDVEFTAAPSWPQLAVQPKLNRTVDVNVDVLRLVRNGRIRRDPAFVVFVLSCEDLDHR